MTWRLVYRSWCVTDRGKHVKMVIVVDGESYSILSQMVSISHVSNQLTYLSKMYPGK